MQDELEVSEKRIADLEERNIQLNTARDEVFAKKLSTQEELNYYKSDSFRKHVIDDFKRGADFVKEVGKEATTFLDKGWVHIIQKLHHHFQDKSILLQDFEADFDDEIFRGGTDFVPYTSEEFNALHNNDIEVRRSEWAPPPPSHPVFWELLEDPGAAS